MLLTLTAVASTNMPWLTSCSTTSSATVWTSARDVAPVIKNFPDL